MEKRYRNKIIIIIIIIVIVSNIILALPAALIKIFVCCDVQCERDLYEDIRNMHRYL